MKRRHRFALPARAILVAACWAFALQASAVAGVLKAEIVDEATGKPVPARVYLRDEDGAWHFVESASPEGSAVRYEKVARVNPNSVEMHTTVSAHPFRAELPAGRYTLQVERGKEYFPAVKEVEIGGDDVSLKIPLKRWIDMAVRGWYSGDTHAHRTLEEMRNLMPAEDLNVAFPLTYWVTKAFTPPAQGDKNVGGAIPDQLIELDATHVMWPRNTEYEIGSVDGQRHLLGAVFVLGHKTEFDIGVPPVGAVAARAKAEGALLDLDKHDWPWAMALPPLMGVQLYELSNNHIWRTEFGFENWVSQAPPHLRPPYGGKSGGEREWIAYTLGNYYTLLNCGMRLVPTAGTANGVHPVPLGYGRVYVHLPDGFSFEAWKRGLAAGRSFVTNGPMLLAQANERDPGETFRSDGDAVTLHVSGRMVSEQPITFAEVIHNGVPERTVRSQARKTAEGAYEAEFGFDMTLEESGWIALRCWEDRPEGRVRFAHTAPWHVEIRGRPLLPPRADRDHLVRRMRDEIERSRGALPREAITEYETVLAGYEAIESRDDSAEVARQARPPAGEGELRYWLENMVWDHRFTPEEVRAVTGMPLPEIAAALEKFGISDATRPAPAKDVLRVRPYPGGRHPRTGFLDGALDPQRDTKVSVFTPWDPASYVVVDVPEAIWEKGELMYLAHTHVPTRWTKQNITLDAAEWNRRDDGALDYERTLPNQVAFGAKVTPESGAVRFELWLRNGSKDTLTGMRVQNCVMLRAADGFAAQTNGNKRLHEPFALARSEDGGRWIITAWTHCNRAWANPPVPCIHSDPQFPGCPPGETRRLRGWLWFYEGDDIDKELARLEEVVKSAD